MRPWSITLLMASFGLGGAERVMVNLANSLSAAGHPTTIIALDGDGPLRARVAPDVRIITLERPRARSAGLALLKQLRAGRPDIVLTSIIHLNLLVCALRPLLPRRTRIVLREASSLVALTEGSATGWSRLMQRTLYPRADLVLATSTQMQAALRATLRVPIATLPNPVEVTQLRDTATPPIRRPGDGRRFVYVGRLARIKAVEDLLAALHDAGATEDHLTIIGDGPERADLEHRIDRLGLVAQVEMMGAVQDPAPWMAGADALILPSRSEGMPNVVLESLAVGTPVIATVELSVLDALRSSAPPGAIRSVARTDLAGALSATVPAPPDGRPRPSLLPDEYTPDHVRDTLAGLIGELLARRVPHGAPSP